MIWIKISQFVAWLVLSTMIVYGSNKFIIPRINDKFKDKLAIRWFLNYFTQTIIGLIGIIFTIYILTFMFFLEVYLLLLVVYFTGIIILTVMMGWMRDLNNEGMSRLMFKEQYVIKEYPNKNVKIISWLQILILTFGLIVIFIIFFILNISVETMAKYILAVSYLLSSVIAIINISSKVSFLTSPALDAELRIDYLASSFYIYYFLYISVYFILWALNIPLSSIVFEIGGYNVRLLMILILGLLALLIFLIFVPYSIGENKTKQERLSFLEKRQKLVEKVERESDLSDIGKSKKNLENTNNEINKKYNILDEELLNETIKISNLREIFLQKEEFKDYKFFYTMQIIKDFFKYKLSYQDNLRKYSEYIKFTLNMGTPYDYKELDLLTKTWKNDVNRELENQKKIKPLFWKSITIAIVILTLINTLFGVKITDLLKSLNLI